MPGKRLRRKNNREEGKEGEEGPRNARFPPPFPPFFSSFFTLFAFAVKNSSFFCRIPPFVKQMPVVPGVK
jgi:hypothetical protein